MKKIISILCTLSLCAAAGFVTVHASEKYTDSYGTVYTYSVNGNTVTITKVSSAETDLTVPGEINGYTVVAVGSRAFANDDCTFKSVTLPDSIESIGEMAFEGREQLASVSLPKNLKDLGKECFSECTSLKSVNLPDSLQSINELTFGKCSSLSSIVIPYGVKEIGRAAFNGCTSLTSVSIPDTVSKIGSTAFYDCSSLTSISIPDSVTEIGGAAFGNDISLKNVDWNKTINSIGYGVFDNTQYIKNYPQDFLLLNNDTLLYKYTGKSVSVDIPASIKSIANGAFRDTSIESITIPNGIDEISGQMFSGCTKLKKVIIPDSVKGISDEAFHNCSSLTEIELPDSLEYIKELAFSGCTSLRQITIPDKVSKIGDRCFDGCKSLEQVHMPSALQTLGNKVFVGCDKLKSINIPKGIINTIPEQSFSPSATLEHVTVDGEISAALANALAIAHYGGNDNEIFYIVDGVLLGYSGTDTEIIIPNTVTEIGKRAFANSVKLTDVLIPNSVTRIAENAFYGQNELTHIEIPGSVKSIGQMAFSNCTKLKDILFEIGNDTLSLGNSAFQFTAVTEDTLKSDGRKYLNKESAFKNTALDQDYIIDDVQDNTQDDIPSSAAAPILNIATTQNGISINVNGKQINFSDANPFIDENGRTQIPIRAVAEALGCTVEWDDKTQTATLSKDNKTVIIKIGDANMQVGKDIITMDTTAQIINERTYIPIRFVGEALGMKVNWENK